MNEHAFQQAERRKALNWYLSESDYWLNLGDEQMFNGTGTLSAEYCYEQGLKALDAAKIVAEGIELEDKSA